MSISIANRLFLGFSAITLALIALGLYAISRIRAAREATDAIVERGLYIAYRSNELSNEARAIGAMRSDVVADAFTRQRLLVDAA